MKKVILLSATVLASVGLGQLSAQATGMAAIAPGTVVTEQVNVTGSVSTNLSGFFTYLGNGKDKSVAGNSYLLGPTAENFVDKSTGDTITTKPYNDIDGIPYLDTITSSTGVISLQSESVKYPLSKLKMTMTYDYTAKATKTVPFNNNRIYRLYNKNTGEYFYTSSLAEKNGLVKVGWNFESVGWAAPKSGNNAIYRVYNPNAKGGDHYYTKSKAEASHLVSLGWKWDNAGKPVFYSGGSKPVYVTYNPNAQSGAHNYTLNNSEANSLIAAGWKYKSVAWYAE